jgi:hypothetical protein
MPETATVDGPPVAKAAATVSASALAIHLDCSRIYIGKREAEGVIQRQGDGFPLDQSRFAYLRYLRRERRRSPRSGAWRRRDAGAQRLIALMQRLWSDRLALKGGHHGGQVECPRRAMCRHH